MGVESEPAPQMRFSAQEQGEQGRTVVQQRKDLVILPIEASIPRADPDEGGQCGLTTEVPRRRQLKSILDERIAAERSGETCGRCGRREPGAPAQERRRREADLHSRLPRVVGLDVDSDEQRRLLCYQRCCGRQQRREGCDQHSVAGRLVTMNERAQRTLLAVGSADPSRAGQPAACLTGAVCYRTKHRIGRSLCCGLDESDIFGRGARGGEGAGGLGRRNQ